MTIYIDISFSCCLFLMVVPIYLLWRHPHGTRVCVPVFVWPKRRTRCGNFLVSMVTRTKKKGVVLSPSWTFSYFFLYVLVCTCTFLIFPWGAQLWKFAMFFLRWRIYRTCSSSSHRSACSCVDSILQGKDGSFFLSRGRDEDVLPAFAIHVKRVCTFVYGKTQGSCPQPTSTTRVRVLILFYSQRIISTPKVSYV